MGDFSWDYVTRTAHDALVEVGATIAATIAEAVDPGIYVVQPDVVYEVRVDDGTPVVARNGVAIAGPEAEPTNDQLITVAAEMAGAATMIDIRTSVELVLAV